MLPARPSGAGARRHSGDLFALLHCDSESVLDLRVAALAYHSLHAGLDMNIFSFAISFQNNLRVPLKRSDGQAQWQNPCNTKRLLSLLVIRVINRHRKV